MKRVISLLAFAVTLAAQPRIDNVLGKMVPPGATSLVGAHMDQIKQTALYRKMLASASLTELDQFAAQTGFDPRRDVRDLLYVSTSAGSVLLARGTFHLNPTTLRNARRIKHGPYEIMSEGSGGFCVLDSTLAAAGDVPVLEAALDEWTSGSHTAAQPLVARLGSVNPQSQLWGISTGTGNFLAEHPPGVSAGIDFSKIFRGLQDTWFEADFSGGLRAEVRGTAATEKDALSLRDAVRGIVGLGRLSVPENQSELLKAWDGITVDQQGRSISLHADIAQDLIDKLVQTLITPAQRRRAQ
ncbi:MAG TPA: hypothetical protein VG297_24495 [Bryobacteraceae bacterium]|jgi:hypothetical protein|nr:hypothetical protein [Bryobacteraceae bacterium]